MVRFIMIAVIVLAACGGDDEPSEGEKACAELEDKLASCRFTNRGKCNTGDPCAVRCAVMADCAQLLEPSPTGSLLQCVAACSGARPDDFICADGKKFTPKTAVCDGQFQCLDGSDEADCANGGSAGMGNP